MVECLLIIYVCSKTTWGTAIELKAFFFFKETFRIFHKEAIN